MMLYSLQQRYVELKDGKSCTKRFKLRDELELDQLVIFANRGRKRQSLSRTTPRSSACRWSRGWWPGTWRGSSTSLSIWRRATILLWKPRCSSSGSYLGTLEPSKVHKEPSWYTMYAVKSTLLWSQGLMRSFTRGLLRMPRHSRKFIWRSEPATMSN